MRSSKSRSRSKSNRPRTLGNIVNRVFDSSGPEGKVRGTPQQIIEKYLFLARDAQLSNDRVAAENFLQHAEHYTRMLAEAQREMAAEQDQRRPDGYAQNGGQGSGQQANNGGQNGGGQNNGGQHNAGQNSGGQNAGGQQQNRPRDDRNDGRDDQRGEGREMRGEFRPDARGDQRGDTRNEGGRNQPRQQDQRSDRGADHRPDPASLPQPVLDLMDGDRMDDDSGLVETPEARDHAAARRAVPTDAASAEAKSDRAPRRPRGPRKPRPEAGSADAGEGSGGDDRQDGGPREAAE